MEMPESLISLFLDIFLYLHIFAGFLALANGLVALIVEKGAWTHRIAGRIFFTSMIVVALSALVISIAKNNHFLLAVSVFSFYMNYIGYRALKNKEITYQWFDWVVAVIAAAIAVFMFLTFTTVLIVFGTLLLLLLYRNTSTQFFREERIKEEQKKRIIVHIRNMAGAYIATSTAFLVVNINFVKPGWIVWLLPTAIGTPIIIYYTRLWKKKLRL